VTLPLVHGLLTGALATPLPMLVTQKSIALKRGSRAIFILC